MSSRRIIKGRPFSSSLKQIIIRIRKSWSVPDYHSNFPKEGPGFHSDRHLTLRSAACRRPPGLQRLVRVT